jgi:hypothetical protein
MLGEPNGIETKRFCYLHLLELFGIKLWKRLAPLWWIAKRKE